MLVDILFYFSFEGAFLFFFWGGRRRHFLYYFWTFFLKQLVCKGPLYLLETGFVAPASDLARATLWSPVLPVVPCFFSSCDYFEKGLRIGARPVPSGRVLDPGAFFKSFDHLAKKVLHRSSDSAQCPRARPWDFFMVRSSLNKGSTSELGQCPVPACSTLGLFYRSIIPETWQ